MVWGFSPTHTPVMPVDSIWNTPEVRPSDSMFITLGSFSGMSFRVKPGCCAWTIFTASSRMVRFRRPKKSIFNRPSSSRVVMIYWVTGRPSLVARGT